MKKYKLFLLGGVVVSAITLGFVVHTHESPTEVVEAASETTVYYAVPSEVVGNYTVKLNVNFRGDGDWWNEYVMEKTSYTFDGKDVYKCTYTDANNGVGCMQFQLYDGDSRISQQQPYGIWTPIVNYNHRIYVHDTGWDTFIPSFETYIPMNPQFFKNWTDDAGSFADKDARFWDENYSFEALDVFFRGETKEGWTGTLTSRTWKQSTQFVYFQLGGARDYDHPNGHAHLVFHYGSYSHDFFNNTFVENPMTLRYFKIPDNEFAAMTANSTDFDMYVEVIDPATGGYGFVNLGYFHVNQTEESTSDAMRYFLNHLSTDSREWEINKRKQIFNTYFENADQKTVFFRTVSDISDDFSTNQDFTKHWYFDHNYFNNDYGSERHFDKAIGTDSYRPDANTNMPFNNDGGFFRGWYEGGSVNAGFVGSDSLRYRFLSRPFVLTGTGVISIKMAGKASLHVIDPTVKNTDTQPADLAWIDNKGFNSDGNQADIASSGFNTTAMRRHVINLEAYVGKTIQLAISDYDTSGWSAAYFDTLDTNYSATDGFKIEYATQTNNSGTFYPVFSDIYINSACKSNENEYGVIYNASNDVNKADGNAILNHQDNSNHKAAHAAWKTYIDNVRGGNQGLNYCSTLTSDGVKAALNQFAGLNDTSKQIVCNSDDFEIISNVPAIYSPNDSYNIQRSLVYLASENMINIGLSYSPILVNILGNTSSPVVIVTSTLLAILLISTSLFFFYKKKSKEI